VPIAALKAQDQCDVLSEAGFDLLAQGRFSEALLAHRAGLRTEEALKDWKRAADSASNISEVYLFKGEIAAATDAVAKALQYARRSGDRQSIVNKLAYHGGALHAAGKYNKAKALFAKAKRTDRTKACITVVIELQVL